MTSPVKHIYILHVGDKIAAYKPLRNGNCLYSFAEPSQFIDFCKGLREDFPDYKLRCVQNKEIEDFLRKKLDIPHLPLKERGR